MKTAETTVAADSTESGSAHHYFQCLQETIPWCFHLQVSVRLSPGRQAGTLGTLSLGSLAGYRINSPPLTVEQ